MRISFGIRRSVTGGWQVGTLPTYDLEGWERLSTSSDAIAYHPTSSAFVWNVVALILPIVVAGSILWSVDPPWKWGQLTVRDADAPASKEQQELNRRMEAVTEELRGRMTEAEWNALTAERQRQREQREAEDARLRIWGLGLGLLCWAVLFPVILLLSWIALRFGLYDLLRYPFDRLDIRVTDTRQLEIQRAGLYKPEVFQQSLDELSHVAISVREEVSYRPNHHHGWVWHVQLMPRSMSGASPITFSVERVRIRPEDISKPPSETRRFAEQLHALSGLPVV